MIAIAVSICASRLASTCAAISRSWRAAVPGGLEGIDGTEHEAMYLTRTLPRIGTKPHHVLYFMNFVDVPVEGQTEIPMRVKVQADEIPDDVEEYEESVIFWVEKKIAS